VQVAVLPDNATALQSVVPPSLNVTVPTPLGFGVGFAVTVAVSVIEAGYVLGFAELVSAVVVGFVLTIV
jgi:hypothetical protein